MTVECAWCDFKADDHETMTHEERLQLVDDHLDEEHQQEQERYLKQSSDSDAEADK